MNYFKKYFHIKSFIDNKDDNFYWFVLKRDLNVLIKMENKNHSLIKQCSIISLV